MPKPPAAPKAYRVKVRIVPADADIPVSDVFVDVVASGSVAADREAVAVARRGHRSARAIAPISRRRLPAA